MATVVLLIVVSNGRWSNIREALTASLIIALVPAVALHLGGNVILADNWGRLLGLLGEPLSRPATRRIWGRGQLARYAFGSAQLLSRPALARKAGVPLRVGVTSTLTETIWQTSITATATALLTPTWLAAVREPALLVASAAVGALLFVAVTWFPATTLGPIVTRVATGPEVPAVARNRGATRAISWWYVANTLTRMVAFVLIYVAVAADPWDVGGVLRAAAAFIAGSLVGRVIIIAPGGLGPREAVTGVLLQGPLTTGEVIVVLAASRLAETAAEGLFLFASSRRARLATRA